MCRYFYTLKFFGLAKYWGGGPMPPPPVPTAMCVYEALAHLGMITCILTARHPVYNESFHCCND